MLENFDVGLRKLKMETHWMEIVNSVSMFFLRPGTRERQGMIDRCKGEKSKGVRNGKRCQEAFPSDIKQAQASEQREIVKAWKVPVGELVG